MMNNNELSRCLFLVYASIPLHSSSPIGWGAYKRENSIGGQLDEAAKRQKADEERRS